MTPLDLLDVLKVQVRLDPGDLTRLRLDGPRPTDAVLADLTAGKPEVLLRLLLRQWIAWTILEADGTPCLLGEKASAVLAAEWRAAQGLGLERAEAVRQEEYQIFYAKTGRCPTCGEQGPVLSDDVDHPHHQQRKSPMVVERPAAPVATSAPPSPRPRGRRGIGRQPGKEAA